MSPVDLSPSNPLYESFLRGAKGRPPIDKWHHYFDVYHRYFSPWRNRQPTVLEIGVQNGGSLHLWKEYFGEGARLFGIDIDPACADRGPEGSRVFIGDQADPAFLRRVLAETGAPDIIIDDGGHTAHQMVVSFETLYPHLTSPGIYLVEDTCTQMWGGGWVGPRGQSFLHYASKIVAALYDWSGKRENFERLRQRPEDRGEPLPASDLGRDTDSISFYDGMVVVRKRRRNEPWAEFREQDPDLPAVMPQRD